MGGVVLVAVKGYRRPWPVTKTLFISRNSFCRKIFSVSHSATNVLAVAYLCCRCLDSGYGAFLACHLYRA